MQLTLVCLILFAAYLQFLTSQKAVLFHQPKRSIKRDRSQNFEKHVLFKEGLSRPYLSAETPNDVEQLLEEDWPRFIAEIDANTALLNFDDYPYPEEDIEREKTSPFGIKEVVPGTGMTNNELWDYLENEELLQFVKERDPFFIRIYDKETDRHEMVIAIKHGQKLPANLPQGYVFTGGVFRTTLLKELGQDAMEPRDLDISAFTELQPDMGLVEKLSEEHMSDDSAHGYGIKEESLAKYFYTRDFTCNEGCIHGGRMYLTVPALLALKGKTIVPTYFESAEYNSYAFEKSGVHPKLVIKALRMQLEFEEMYGHGEIKGIEDWQWDIQAVPLFWIALHLNKAFERGDRLAQAFFLKLLEKGTVASRNSSGENPVQADSATELAVSINWHMHKDGDPFSFLYEELNLQAISTNEDAEEGAKYVHAQTTKEYVTKHPFDNEADEYEYYADLAAQNWQKIAGSLGRQRYERSHKGSPHQQRTMNKRNITQERAALQKLNNETATPGTIEHAMREAFENLKQSS